MIDGTVAEEEGNENFWAQNFNDGCREGKCTGSLKVIGVYGNKDCMLGYMYVRSRCLVG